mgnify:CR=1 FL=1
MLFLLLTAPYKQPEDVALEASSPYCVKLSWKEPKQSNRLTGYKVTFILESVAVSLFDPEFLQLAADCSTQERG